VVEVLFIEDVDFLWCWWGLAYSGSIGVLPIASIVFLVHACLGPGLV